MADSDKHFELAVELSRDALKALLIVNGGAATALIALMDKTDAKHNYASAVICFAAGAVSAVICYCLGYFSQLSYANHRLLIEHGQNNEAARSHLCHNIFQGLAIAFVTLTLVAMVLGILVAAHLASL